MDKTNGIYVVTALGSPVAWFVSPNGKSKSAEAVARAFVGEHLPDKVDQVRYIAGPLIFRSSDWALD